MGPDQCIIARFLPGFRHLLASKIRGVTSKTAEKFPAGQKNPTVPLEVRPIVSQGADSINTRIESCGSINTIGSLNSPDSTGLDNNPIEHGLKFCRAPVLISCLITPGNVRLIESILSPSGCTEVFKKPGLIHGGLPISEIEEASVRIDVHECDCYCSLRLDRTLYH